MLEAYVSIVFVVALALLAWQVLVLRGNVADILKRLENSSSSDGDSSGSNVSPELSSLKRRVSDLEKTTDQHFDVYNSNFMEISGELSDIRKRLSVLEGSISGGGGGGGGGDSETNVKLLAARVTKLEQSLKTVGSTANETASDLSVVKKVQNGVVSDVAKVSDELSTASKQLDGVSSDVIGLTTSVKNVQSAQTDFGNRLNLDERKYNAAITRIDDYSELRVVYLAPKFYAVPDNVSLEAVVNLINNGPFFSLYDLVVVDRVPIEPPKRTDQAIETAGGYTSVVGDIGDGLYVILICPPTMKGKVKFSAKENYAQIIVSDSMLFRVVFQHDNTLAFDASVVLADDPKLIGSSFLVAEQRPSDANDWNGFVQQLEKAGVDGRLPDDGEERDENFSFFWHDSRRVGSAARLDSLITTIVPAPGSKAWGIRLVAPVQFRPLR